MNGYDLIARTDQLHALGFIKVRRGDMQISMRPFPQPLKAIQAMDVARDRCSDQRRVWLNPPTMRRDNCHRTLSSDDADAVVNVLAFCALKCLEVRVLVSHWLPSRLRLNTERPNTPSIAQWRARTLARSSKIRQSLRAQNPCAFHPIFVSHPS